MAETEKHRRVTVAEQIGPQVNRYYLGVSRKYLIAGIAVMLLLVLYLFGVFTFFGEYVTYDNLKFLMKDFDAMTVTGSTDVTKIVYNGSDTMDFAYFRSGLALCDGDRYSYYDTSGVLLLEDTLGYSSPMMETSEKYLLVYDLGGTGYSVYNQLTRILDKTTEREIVAANISDDGSIVTATRSSETRYIVDWYSGSYSKVMSIHKENYVFALALSPDGRTLAICSAVPSSSDFDTEIEIVRRGNGEAIATVTCEHAMPLQAVASDKGFTVLTSTGILFLSKNGEELGRTEFGGMTLKYADINETTAAVVGSTNALGSVNRILVFDTADTFGEVLFDTVVEQRIMGIYATRDLSSAYAYAKLSNDVGALMRDGTFRTEENGIAEALRVIPLKNGALICESTSATPAFTH